MALVTCKNYRRIYVLILIALIFSGAVIYWRVQQRPGLVTGSYEKLAELPAPFVVSCQKAAAKFKLPWELIASIYQVRLEHNFLNNYPEAGEVVSTAARLAQSAGKNNFKDIVKTLGFSKELTNEISSRTELLQRKSDLLTRAYTFPYKKSYFYQDTWGADREGGKRRHEGTDIFAPEGTPIYSVGDGTVEKLGWNRLGGERVGIRSSDKVYFYYAHLAKINPELKVGMSIKAGELIGFTGHTGDAITTPDHLHFGMELENGIWINPYNFLRYWEGFL